MKALIWTDLEGVAGIDSFVNQTYADAKYYELSKELLTEEVNAAVEGLLKRNVNDILVADYHGPGGICYEKLHPEAKLLHGRPLAPLDILGKIFQEYDIAMIIGQHAMAGVQNGTLNHTQNSKTVEYYKLNGKFIGEIAQVALYLGALGVPTVYLTGDDAACREAADLIPNITTAAVKTGLSRSCAISLSKEKARAKIKKGMILAVDSHKKNPVKPLVWQGPFTLEKRFHTSHAADESFAGDWQRIDPQTIRLERDSILDIIYA